MERIPGERGTALWAFNRFRAEVLVAFLRDLELQESTGISDPDCDRIRETLHQLTEGAWEAGQFDFRLVRYAKDFGKFAGQYADWNALRGENGEIQGARREQLR